jgi:hypothetical protein
MRDLKKLAVMALAACALVLSTVTAAGAQTHAQRVTPKPTGAVLFTPDVVLVGKHYKSLERLTVTLVGFKTYVRKIRATKLGSFRIVIGAIDLNDCNAYKLKVVGALGSRFSLSHPTAPC